MFDIGPDAVRKRAIQSQDLDANQRDPDLPVIEDERPRMQIIVNAFGDALARIKPRHLTTKTRSNDLGTNASQQFRIRALRHSALNPTTAHRRRGWL